MIFLVTLLWAGPQEEARLWEALYDARLVEASDGTPQVAVQYYKELLADLTPNNPLRGDVLYWYGRARFMNGDLEGAGETLRLALAYPQRRAAAEALLAHIDLTRRGVMPMPALWNFEDGQFPFVRAADAAASGSLSIQADGENHALSWKTNVRAGQIDHISLGFSEDQTLKTVSFRARSSRFPADVQVSLNTAEGVRFSAPLSIVSTDSWVTVRLPLVAFRSLDPSPNPSLNAIRLVEIQDLTGYLSSDRGENTILIDDFALE